MKKLLLAAVAALTLTTAGHAASINVKTRLDHLSGTTLVVVISNIPSEITSITCESWTMLGMNSWKGQNNFSIPAAAANGYAIAIMDAKGFDGYCKQANSIVAHTDDGDFVGTLDRGPGSWSASTKLTFVSK